ncbi:MAG TPA: hypothetical protein VF166_12055 [Gemmatimonadaceae bacterium]
MHSSTNRRMMMAMCLVLAACSSKGSGTNKSDRGAGLSVASLPAGQQAAAYAAALRSAFDVRPGLVLLVDPMLLPRQRGASATEKVPADVVRRLDASGVTQGTCQPRSGSGREPPICSAKMAGYVVQLSNIFRVAQDTVQLYATAERYRPTSDTVHFASPLRFEQRYILARRGDGWEVVSQARLLTPQRGTA